MGVAMKALGIDRMEVEERLALVEEIWDSLAEQEGAVPLTEPQRSELERRWAEDEANPDDLTDWEQVQTASLARWAK